MAFDSSVISDCVATQAGAEVHLSWVTSSAGPFQVYVAGRLAWSGFAKSCSVIRPPSLASIHVGAVAATEIDADLSAGLPASPGTGDRVSLSWLGGSYLADDLTGFHVYGSATPGGAISYATPLATISAYPAGITADGYGDGGYGDGGYGAGASSYSWVSPRLASGVWQFEVRPFDAAGNERTGNPTASVTISSPPAPPARNASGSRLSYSYNATSGVATLAWLASPG